MKKIAKLKKAMALISSATLLSCTAANTMNYATVTAAESANYAEALAMSLYFFDAQECGTEVDDNCITWRGNCHTYDAEASLDNANNLTSTEKALIQAANGGSNTVDVSGGYHDAGDHIKFNVTMGFAASSLAMSYYMNPGAYETANCEDHLFEILKKTCDYLMKTTYLDSSGNVYAVCATVSNESDHNYWTTPESQTYDRPTYWITKSYTNSETTATMASALAGTAYVFKDINAEYSAECLKYAKALYDFASTYTGMNDVSSGLYSPGDSYYDDLALAQTWLYLNGEASLPTTYKPSGNGSYNNQYYDCWVYCWNKSWSGYATMMYYITGDSTWSNEMLLELNNQGGLSTSSYNAVGGYGASRYNCALQMLALGLAKGDASSTYALSAKYQTDYLLGNNQKSTSFLIGYGDTWPQQIHHRAANLNKTGMTYVLYGALVGGPTDSNCTYTDYWESYASTEPALDYNACFALACAGLVNLYGGDASEIDDVIKNADEIDETYVFGVAEDPQPSTEATEATTETPSGLKGDVNVDGLVNVSDAVCLGRYLVNDFSCEYIYTTSGECVQVYTVGGNSYEILEPDVNEDEKVNVFDYVALRRILIGQ